MAYDSKTERLISIKKLAAKAHTSNDKGLANEALPSGITVTSETIFGEAVSGAPSSTSLYTITGQVEYIRFPATFIAGSDSDTGRHGFELKLPSDYESASSNPGKGTYPFLNNQSINITSGSLQLVPTSFSTSYEAKPYYGGSGTKDSGTQIPVLDARDWYMDYFNGIMFQQDPPGTGDHASNPDFVEAFLYIGDMLGTVVSSLGGGGDITAVTAGSGLTGGATSNAATLNVGAGTGITVNADDVAINNSVVATLTGSVFSGTVSAPALSGSLTHLSGGTSYLIAGNNIQIVTGSSGAVTITGTATAGAAGANTQIQYNNAGSFGASSAFTFTGTEVELNASSPKYTLRRASQSEDSSLSFEGAAGAAGSAITHQSGSNDLVFKTFGNGGSSTEEILRLGSYYNTSNRQVILLSGSGMHAGAMQPKEAKDINFFVSGSIGSKGTSIKGTAVFGGDVVISGTLGGGSPLDIDSKIIVNTNRINSEDNDFIVFGADHAGRELITTNIPRNVVMFLSGGNSASTNEFNYEDMAFFVSGSIGSKGTATRGTAVFGGDVHVSGSINGISTSHVLFSDDTSLTNARVITAGDGISISVATPRQIIISNSGIVERTKKYYDVTGSHPSNHMFEVSGSIFSTVDYNPNVIDVFYNGQSLRSGSIHDYELFSTGSIKFKFDLVPDDVIQVVIFK